MGALTSPVAVEILEVCHLPSPMTIQQTYHITFHRPQVANWAGNSICTQLCSLAGSLMQSTFWLSQLANHVLDIWA